LPADIIQSALRNVSGESLLETAMIVLRSPVMATGRRAPAAVTDAGGDRLIRLCRRFTAGRRASMKWSITCSAASRTSSMST
jgi:hypothetical protein